MTVSVFLKTEREWEETEIKIYKSKREKEKKEGWLQPCGFPLSKVKDQGAVPWAEGQAVGWDTGPAPPACVEHSA